jgi:hypothetical protein
MTELDPGAKELIALVGDADGPTEKQRSRVRAAVLAQAGGVGTAALAESVGRAAANAAAGVAGAGAAGAVASLGAAGAGAGAGAGGAALAGLTGGAAFAAKMVAIGAVLTGIGTGGYAVVAHQRHEKLVAIGATAPAASTSERLVAIGATARAHTGVAPSQAQGTEAPPVSADPVVPDPVPHEEPAPAPEAPPPAAAVPVRPRPRAEPVPEVIPETFEAETQALREAVSALRSGHPEVALPALAAQDAKYPHGVLGEERAVARIEALCAVGRTGEANTLASRFLAQHPRSLQAARVRASCGGAQGAP